MANGVLSQQIWGISNVNGFLTLNCTKGDMDISASLELLLESASFLLEVYSRIWRSWELVGRHMLSESSTPSSLPPIPPSEGMGILSSVLSILHLFLMQRDLSLARRSSSSALYFFLARETTHCLCWPWTSNPLEGCPLYTVDKYGRLAWVQFIIGETSLSKVRLWVPPVSYIENGRGVVHFQQNYFAVIFWRNFRRTW